jgi:WD40 repeat protein
VADVFISYSRKDIAFARILNDMLKARGLESWVDWQNIPPSAEWLAEVFGAIESSDVFVFVVSRASVKSEVCSRELAHAIRNHKRVVPIVVQGVSPEATPGGVKDLNWIFFRKGVDDYQQSFDLLLRAVQTDLEWVRDHSRLQTRALEWERGSRDRSSLLRGRDLRDADEWLASSPGVRDISPTDAQREFIVASHADSRRRRRRVLAVSGVALIAVAILGTYGWYQTTQAEKQSEEAREQGQLARSRELASLSASTVSTSPELALLLGIEAIRTADTAEARDSVLDALLSYPRSVPFPPGHAGAAWTVAYRPDGEVLASGGEDGLVRLWNVSRRESPEPLGSPLSGHSAAVRAVAFSPDGGLLISAGDDSTVRFWDVSRPELPLSVGSPLSPPRGAAAVTISPDGRTLVTGGPGGDVLLWDITDPAAVGPGLVVPSILSGISGLAFTSDGKTLAAGGLDGLIVLYDVADMAKPRILGIPLMFHSGPVRSIAMSPTAKTLASGGDDGSLLLWKAYQVSAADDGLGGLTLAHPEAPNLVGGPVLGEQGEVLSLAFSPDGKTLAAGGADHSVLLWDVSNPASPGRIGSPLGAHEAAVQSLAFSPDGDTLTSADAGGTIISWDVAGSGSALIAASTPPGEESVAGLAFGPDPGTLLVGGKRGSILQWDVSSPTTPEALGPAGSLPGDQQEAVTFGHDGRDAVSLAGKSARMWDMSDPARPLEIGSGIDLQGYAHGASLASGPALLAIGAGGSVALWDVSEPGTVNQLGVAEGGLSGTPSAVALSSDGAILAAGGCGVFVETSLLDGYCAAGEFMLWDVSDPSAPEPLTAPIRTGSRSVTSLTFSPNSATLAVGVGDGTLTLWSAGTPASLSQIGPRFGGHSAAITALAFGPDGGLLVSGDTTGRLVIWQVDPASLMASGCQRAGRNLTASEWAQYFPGEAYRSTCAQWPAAAT